MLLWLGAICLVLIGGGIARRVAIPDAVIWCALGFGAAFLPGFDGLKTRSAPDNVPTAPAFGLFIGGAFAVAGIP